MLLSSSGMRRSWYCQTSRIGTVGTACNTLHPKHPELVALAQQARIFARYVAWFAAERAVVSVALSDPPVPSILEAIRSSKIQEWVRQRQAMAGLVERLEGSYWDASDAMPQDQARIALAFRRARAASAVLAALGSNEVEAGVDAVYEAYHALPEREADAFVDEAKAKLRDYGEILRKVRS